MAPELWLIILLMGSFLGLLFLGIPVGFALGGSAFAVTALATALEEWAGIYTGLNFLKFSLSVDRIYGLAKSDALVALPMFILMGCLLDQSGVAERMMNAQQKLLGRIPGGLALGVTSIGLLLAASTGIIGASVVLLATLALPAMARLKYAPTLAAGAVCASGTLGILLPPSIMLILMSAQLDVSTGDLFLGAILPGLILAGLYMAYILARAILQPASAPRPTSHTRLTANDWLALAKSILPAIFLILLVLGSIFFGIATPTESSGMGALGAVLLALANKRFSLFVFKKSLYDTLRTVGFLAAIFIGATCFSLALRRLGGDALIADAIASISSQQYGAILVALLIVFILGFFLEWIEITLILLPILGPIVMQMDFAWAADSGLDASSKPVVVWFAVLCAVALQTSFLTPPVGYALFYMRGAAPKEITLRHIYKGVIPFIALQLVALAFVLLFPALVTWLPAISYAK